MASRAQLKKRRRMMAVGAGLTMLGIAAALVLTAFEDNLVFFYSPTDIATTPPEDGRRIRVGGLVEPGSIDKRDNAEVSFDITDGAKMLSIDYQGVLPDLFREGQGIVAQGVLLAGGRFRADEVLAKHDETYMPPEVAEALKKSGRWKGGEESYSQ